MRFNAICFLVAILAFSGAGESFAAEPYSFSNDNKVPAERRHADSSPNTSSSSVSSGVTNAKPEVVLDEDVPVSSDGDGGLPETSTDVWGNEPNEGEGISVHEAFGEEGFEDAYIEREVAECNFKDWIGKPVDKAAVDATGRPWRELGPGEMVTQEYMFGRINLMVQDGIVKNVTCG